jgi:hypothetical protein
MSRGLDNGEGGVRVVAEDVHSDGMSDRRVEPPATIVIGRR